MFTEEEIKIAKEQKEYIIKNGSKENKANYIAGEICMYDELTPKWIDINKELPKERGHFLILCPRSFPKNYKGVIAEFYEDNQLFYGENSEDNQLFYGENSEDVHEDATHWMELPSTDL